MFSGVMPPNPVSSSGSRFAHFWSGLHSRGVRSATSCKRILTEIPPTMRLVFRLRRYGHITDALAILHWLRVPQRVDFKIAVMAFRVLHGLAPPYLDQLVRVADLPGRCTRSLRSSPSHQLDIPAYRLEFHRPSVVSGRRINSVEHCHLRFSRHLCWLCFVNDWRLIYFRNHSLMSYSDDYVSVDLAITFVILDTLNIFLIDWLIVGNRLWCSGQQQIAIVDPGRNEGVNQYGCRFVIEWSANSSKLS